MILDAGCGNRCMWKEKSVDGIIYVDVETKLQRKPTIFADNRCLPFKKESFDTIFFDPPHAWGMESSMFYSFPNREMQKAKYTTLGDRGITSYYGVERYKTRQALVAYIYRAEKELYRVLKPDGILWLRWTNLKTMDEQHALNIFNNWTICLKHEIGSSKQTLSDCGSYWFMLTKKPLLFIQPELCIASVDVEVLV